MNEVMRSPMDPSNPLRFSVLRVPFFLEPEYDRDESWHETNRKRLERKWGGKEQFQAQKLRHRLKERGREVGIENFNLDRLASSTLASHRLVQWVTKHYGCAISEALYNDLNHRHFIDGQKLNDSAMLCDAATAAGVDRDACAEFLASDKGLRGDQGRARDAQSYGHSLHPQLRHRRQVYRLRGGAQSELVEIFRTIEATGEGAPASSFAEVLRFRWR